MNSRQLLNDASSTCTTGALSNCGSIFTAVWMREVVAPPISNGMWIFLRCISLATKTISSNEGVINPLKPMISTFSATAVSNILSQGYHHSKIQDVIIITG